MSKPVKGKGGRGAPRKYDWSLIRKRINEGKTDTQIANEIGCCSDYVGDLRWRMIHGRLRNCL